MPDKKSVLKQYFGHSDFRSGQGELVDAILSRRDALCVMPTGAGKSVCYQVPALMFDGVTLVVSPLISLMKDQVNALTQNGIRAAYLNSSLSFAQYAKVVENIENGVYKIIYVAPERLVLPDFLAACRKIRIDLLAIDEAHCISQWGQSFRPGYLKIADFVNSLDCRPTVAAFTATATSKVKDDIESALGLVDPFRITTCFDRPNLKFTVIKPKKKADELKEILDRHSDDFGIIYCSTRKTVDELTESLEEYGFSVTKYHAGLSEDARRQNQEDFVFDRKQIMVATNAFGMGIDKSNVSYVVHYNMPKDIESYYQEAGRAGRDGSDAECILLYSPSDVNTNRFLIENSEPNPELSADEQELMRERDYERLRMMTFYSTTSTCLRSFILDYFGEKGASYCGNCSNCLTEFDQHDITIDSQKILSCIKRTGERFGRKMICDILRESKNERLLAMELDSQTTYGLMKEHSERSIREMIEHLEREGYITTRDNDYPTLALGEKAYALLFKNEKVTMMKARPKEVPSAKTEKKKSKSAPDVDSELLVELKSLRRELADAKGVPAYVIFSDATLTDMCRKHPTTAEQFLEVSGVGKVKLELYGSAFMEKIRTHG